jgi:hypothetical protein
MLMTQSLQGQAIQMRVSEVRDKTIVVDLNHPLAGKTRRESYGHQGQLRPNNFRLVASYEYKKPGLGLPPAGL